MSTVSPETTLNITIDGREIEVEEGTTIWEAAREIGVNIPVLCHDPRLRPVGECRVCVVEVEGAKTLVASCSRRAEKGMVVRTSSPKIDASRKMLVELLLTDHPTPCARQAQTNNCELENLAKQLGVAAFRFMPMGAKSRDNSSPVIAVDHRACILCDRCIRACDEIQCNEVIGRAGKGYLTSISFDNNLPMGSSSCVACGECATYCPTGALTHKPLTKIIKPQEVEEVNSVCPFCGVGCAITYSVQDNTIVRVNGLAESPANLGRLCVKGRYGYDYSHSPERLTVPLIRKVGASKEPRMLYANPRDAFREASWDEALDLAAKRFREIKDKHGPKSLAGFGSAKCSVEEAYLFQKIVRVAFGNNNVDHCARLCHGGSVTALLQTLGSAEVSNPFSDVLGTEVAIIIGSSPTENHPVAATFMKQAAKKGVKLIVMDPRRPPIAQYAALYVQFKPGADVALLNGIMNVIIDEKLYNEEFIEQRTVGFDELRRVVSKYTPELAEEISGVPAETIREIARLYGRARRAMIFWGMGISQSSHGAENARCLVSLALITGNIGRPGTGLHPLRGQNNVQGVSDMGLLPMFYPGYQSVEDPKARTKFEKAWGAQLDPKRGLTLVEILSAVLEGEIKAMYIHGENPAINEPNLNKARKELAAIEFLVVQDIFLTETAEFADVILPASSFPEKDGVYTSTDRRVQLGRRAIKPPGQARPDWEILVDFANRMGCRMNYNSPRDIFEEIRQLTPGYAGITYDRLEKVGGLVWPCPTEQHPGTPVLHLESFPAGKGKLIPAEYTPAKEQPDQDYPFVLNTANILSHWLTGAMTTRASVLNAIEPTPYLEMNPADMDRLRIGDTEMVKVKSRRGEINIKVHARTTVQIGSVFLPFHYTEAAANFLTIDALDPAAKIPEYKFCAVRIEKLHGR